MRHRVLLSIVDLCLVALATLGSQLLRDNLETRPDQFLALLPYLTISLLAALPVMGALGLNRSIWRMSALPDYVGPTGGALLIVVAAVALAFLFNLLEGIARSLPIIQAGLLVFGMVGVRLVSRLRHAKRRSPPLVEL